ncbi:Cys-tRNA(Pro) deacylase [Humibacillus xanthopallidus]|uniref:Cys-tRNA(Pro) deacylase n=1 Tax=Humibacillus xanthopallidus TaxID=412689 RepID=A0A543PPT9_9MICO|nr:YbaK/EbsC family protein [Humibacillus xanthopallidus]TQN46085.1 Cys-tRNA(Pro) deacylase [Humibacillus xanthopallidus]
MDSSGAPDRDDTDERSDSDAIRTPAVDAVREAGIEHTVTRHGRVASLEEAAAARGIEPRDLIKTLVVRRSEDEHVFVLVPGNRTFSWAKVRALLGTNRISMPDADTARAVTGYERGTITPFGSVTRLPVIADTHLVGRRISIGGGAHGVGLTVQGDDVIRLFDATVADISDEETRRP